MTAAQNPTMDTLIITRPDDWHLHVRDGEAMRSVVPHTAAQFGRAIIMPNLKPPVTTAEQALEYKARILAAVPQGLRFEPLMTLYLTDNLPPEEIVRAKAAGVVACKLYPAGATTNSDFGVTDLRKIYPTLEAMQREGMLLLVHGEVTSSDIDLFDREAAFIDQHLIPLRRDFPELKIVFEHITTKEAAQYVTEADNFVGATITPSTCCSTAMPSSPVAFALTITACPCSSAKPTAWRWWRLPPVVRPSSSWAPTARRTRPT